MQLQTFSNRIITFIYLIKRFSFNDWAYSTEDVGFLQFSFARPRPLLNSFSPWENPKPIYSEASVKSHSPHDARSHWNLLLWPQFPRRTRNTFSCGSVLHIHLTGYLEYSYIVGWVCFRNERAKWVSYSYLKITK